MIAVVDRLVQYPNRYKLTNSETGEVLGTFDVDEVAGTVKQVGTEINKALFDSIAADLAARVVSNGGELSKTIVTFPDISGTAANVASGDTSATLWGKVKNWFSRLKALAFKDTIRNSDVASNAAIAQSKISGLESALASKANNADLAAIAKSGDLADATQDATHRVVTDTEKATWNKKQNAITGAASTIASKNLTANRALVSNDSGKVAVSAVTATELGYLDGVTSNIQSQLNNSGKISSGGGFQGGTGASAGRGAAIGRNASAELGGAVGNEASASTGGAVGHLATVTADGFAGGQEASAESGGAVGSAASATNGFAGGYKAKATASGAVQLGQGTNNNANTLQFRDYQIVDANGNIPASRLSANSPVRSVNGKTGAVTLAKNDVGLSNVDNVKQYSASNPPPYPVRSVNGKTGKVNLTTADAEVISGLAFDENFGLTSGNIVGYRIGDLAVITVRFVPGSAGIAWRDWALATGLPMPRVEGNLNPNPEYVGVCIPATPCALSADGITDVQFNLRVYEGSSRLWIHRCTATNGAAVGAGIEFRGTIVYVCQ